MAMDMQHYVHGLLAGLAENLFQDVDDELHRRVVVVQQQNLVERRFLGLGARFGDDAGAGIARPVLAVIAVARILHKNDCFAFAPILARIGRLPSGGTTYVVTASGKFKPAAANKRAPVAKPEPEQYVTCAI